MDSSSTSVPAPVSAARQFDRQAERYEAASWHERVADLLEWIVAECAPMGGETVLDVATGGGAVALALAPRVARVHGIDVSERMLAQARANAVRRGIENAAFELAPAESLPFAAATFDIVTVRLAPHHFTSVAAFLGEARRVLRPGGQVLIADTTVPDGEPEAAAWQNRVEAARDASHVRNYAPSEWSAMARAAGFAVRSVTGRGGGITIPLTEWLADSGCAPEQSAMVSSLFDHAPDAARAAYQIVRSGDDGVARFTWPRVLLHAVARN